MFIDSKLAVRDAISLASSRRPVFSTLEVSEIAGVDINDEATVQTVAELIEAGSLTEVAKTDQGYALLSPTAMIECWWIRTVLRWHQLGIRDVGAGELATAMRGSFGDFVGGSPPTSIINVGVELGLIAPTYDGKSFTSPWIHLMNSVGSIRARLMDASRSASPRDWFQQSLEDSRSPNGLPTWHHILQSLDLRQRQVIEWRFGLVDGQRHTLEDIGETLELTRERVRQIERTAFNHLRQSDAVRQAAPVIAREFLDNGASLILSPSMTVLGSRMFNALYGACVNLIRSLGTLVLADAKWARNYEQTISDENASIEFVLSDFQLIPDPIETMLAKLPEADGRRLERATRSHLRERAGKLPRKAQVYIALRKLGTASHYSEVAGICNILWPDRPLSHQNAINLLMACDDDSRFGVVWIGRKGMYGLTEHGYTKPHQDLAETVAEIVNHEYGRTGAAVSIDTVMERMLDYRQHPDKSSVLMALSFSDGVTDIGRSRFVPAGTEPNRIDAVSDSGDTGYDFSEAFSRFAKNPNGSA